MQQRFNRKMFMNKIALLIIIFMISSATSFGQDNKEKAAANSANEDSESSSRSTSTNSLIPSVSDVFNSNVKQIIEAKLPRANPQSFSLSGIGQTKYEKDKIENKNRAKLSKEIVKELKNSGKVVATPTVNNSNNHQYQDASVIRNSQNGIAQNSNKQYGQITNVKPTNSGYSTLPLSPKNQYGSIPVKKTGAVSAGNLPKRYDQVPPLKTTGSTSAPGKLPNQYIQPNQPLGQREGYSKMPVAPAGAYGSVPTKKTGAVSAGNVPLRYGKIPPARVTGSTSSPAKAPNQYTKPHEPFGHGYSKMPGAPSNAYGSVPVKKIGAVSAGNVPLRYGKIPVARVTGSTSSPAKAPNQYTKPHEPFGYGYSKMPGAPTNAYGSVPVKKAGALSAPQQFSGYRTLPLKPNRGAYSSPARLPNQYDKPPKPNSSYKAPPKPPIGSTVATKPRYDNAPPRKSATNTNNRANTQSKGKTVSANVPKQPLHSRIKSKAGTKKSNVPQKGKLSPANPKNITKSTTIKKKKYLKK